MSRYLTSSQIESALSSDKSVEQFLGAPSSGSVAWLEIRPANEAFELWRIEVLDEGSEEFIDLYSFSQESGEWPESPLSVHASASEALRAAEQSAGAKPDRWVNQFVIQDEYRDFVRNRS